MDEHAFPPTEFAVALSLPFITSGGSGGIMTTARPGLPYPCSPQSKTPGQSSPRGSNVTG